MFSKFKSKAVCDLILLGPGGDRLLRAIGKEPGAGGIIGPRALPAAIRALTFAISMDEARRVPSGNKPGAQVRAHRADAVTLRQLAWPFVEMMKLAYDEGEAIVWHGP